MRLGAAGKTPAWRVGSWVAGVALLLLIPLGRGHQGLAETAVVLAAGLVLTAPHALSRLGGAPPYRAPESPVRLRPVGVPTYLLYLLLVRLPVWLGDALYTALWRALGEGHARGTARTGRRAVAVPSPYGQDEPTWPPLDLVPGERGAGPEGRLGRALRRAGGRSR